MCLLTHTHACTLISNIHTHIIRGWGRKGKDELEEVEKKRGGRKHNEKDEQCGSHWNEVFDFILPFTEKEDRRKKKMRPTEKMPLGLTRLPQAHYL